MPAEPPWRPVVVAGLAVLAAGCAGKAVKDGPPRYGKPAGPSAPAVPRPEPLSRYGNGPEYEVLGKRYRVMASSKGFSERGMASWYGRKFHGRLTSNREIYDMHAMTAAHKTLPLPTWVEVRNLRNDRRVLVRVNDRGPFAHNRIIDLSYAAAQALDMIEDGTSMVEVRVVDTAAPASGRAAPQPSGNGMYVQVGAFGKRANARRQLALLRRHGVGGDTKIVPDTTRRPALYRVQIGPIASVFDYERIVAALRQIGIDAPYLIRR